MGQVTLPVLNRKGYCSFWENHWNSKILHTKNINEDLFLKKFFFVFLANWYSNKDLLLNKRSTFNNKIKFNKYIKYKNVRLTEASKYLIEKVKRYPHTISRIFLIKYKNWLLVYVFIYVPKEWKSKFITKKIKRNSRTYLSRIYKLSTYKIKFNKK